MPSSTGGSDDHPRAFAETVTRQEALEEFRRWRRWWLPKPRSAGVELVRLPVHLFVVTLVLEPEGETRELNVVVDGMDGTVKRLDASVDPARRDEENALLCEPLIDPSLARERLEEELPAQVLQPALRHRGRIDVGAVRFQQTLGYPHWIEHLGRQQRRDVRALDGVTGARVGSRGRAAIVAGLVRANADRE